MPVVVDFWAEWRLPCRATAPIFKRAARELEPRARFAKLNVDEEPSIAARCGVRGIPTLIVFDQGKVAKEHAGLTDINFLRGLVREQGGAIAGRVGAPASSPGRPAQSESALQRCS
jgi:thioredoxin 2